ncbi:unnamed protein product [Nesidiocoris tenuis]|uniref:Uncharacterized protein n=1 Tax=Nesidiocoris tenuis TaxID=355587 RepID=A0A6H5G354_9HEMI|nr:unnamed protein product [Nesidiocoris tenuis]
MDSQAADDLLLPDEMVEQLARAQDSGELQQQFIIQQQPEGQQQLIIQQPEGQQQQIVIQQPTDQQQKIIIKQVQQPQQQQQQQQQPVIKHLQLEQLLQPGQQQPGMTASPKLQQIITAAVQKPQLISVTPKLQQVVVASGQQGSTAASKLQQIISAAVQPGSAAGTQQIHRIVTNAPQGVIGTSQLQQMISGGTQGQQGTHRIQHIVVSSSQLQQIVNSSAQFQQSVPVTQQQQKVITSTSSSPLLQSVIASTQSQGGKPAGQVLLQGVRMATSAVKPGQQVIRPGTSQVQQQAIVPSSQPQQVIRQASSAASTVLQPNTKIITSQQQTVLKPGASQVQYVTKTVGSNVVQAVKNASPAQLQQNQRQPIHVIKPSTSSQSQQPKTTSLTPLQQASKTPVFPQASQAFRTTTAHTLQTVSTTQSIAPKPTTVTQVKREGVTATPRLQQPATTTTPSKKEKKESSTPKEPKVPPKPTTLGDLVGRLTQGSRHVKRFKEDRRNIVKPVKTLNYGCYGSFAPAYDSTFSNLSKEESDLLNGSFDEFEPSPQIKQILLKDYDYTLDLADNLIDILSGGKEAKKLKLEKEEPPEEMEDSSFETRRASLNEDDEMATLSSLGIDLSHLSNANDSNSTGDEGSPVVQQTLEHTTNLLKKLQELQYERLSVPPHPRLGHTILPPTETEMKLATEITGNLTCLAKQVPPGALIGDHFGSIES